MRTVKQKKNKILVTLVKKILVLFLLAIVIYNLLYTIVKPISKNHEFFGIRFLTVDSNSMEPALAKQDLIITKKTQSNKLEENDIILYSKNDEYRITRIVKIRENNGTISFLIKGDNNYYIDEILSSSVKGKVVKTVRSESTYFKILNLLGSKILTIFIVIYLILLVRYKRKIKMRNKRRREMQQVKID